MGIFLRKAILEDAPRIHEVMEQVTSVLENPDLFVCDDLGYVEEQLSGHGFGVVACADGGDVVGCFLFRYPGLSEDNLGRDLSFSEEALWKVVHMESAAVLPEYRGQQLQRKMLRYGEDLIDRERYRYLLATVSPHNPASYTSLEREGFFRVLTKEKYGGLLRHIYQKKL